MTTWITFETLTPNAMSVASVGAEPRAFANPQRVLQRLLSKLPAVQRHLTVQRVLDTIATTRRRGVDDDRVVLTAEAAYTLATRAVLGPGGVVHAVRLWIGPSAGLCEPSPAFGAVWDLRSQTIQQPPPMVAPLPGLAPEDYKARMTLAELFHLASAFDRQDEVLDLLYHPAPGRRLQFDLAATHPSGSILHWRNTIRLPDDVRSGIAHWLVEAVTPTTPPRPVPDIGQRGVRDALRRAGIHLAVIQTAYASIGYWLSDPAPWIRWGGLSDGSEVFHPRDRVMVAGTVRRLSAQTSTDLAVRTLNHGGGYGLTRLRLYPCAPGGDPELAIGELSRDADSAVEPGENPSASVHAVVGREAVAGRAG